MIELIWVIFFIVVFIIFILRVFSLLREMNSNLKFKKHVGFLTIFSWQRNWYNAYNIDKDSIEFKEFDKKVKKYKNEFRVIFIIMFISFCLLMIS